MRDYNRQEERTGVQESSDFHPNFDVQSDFVMVYGLHNLKARIKQWKKRGYVIHLMTGVSWGGYQDYLYGRYDGITHHEEGQRSSTEAINHGPDTPYMVPSNSFAHYLAEQLKYAIDCGVEAIHLEEPEFWAWAGYSEAFKREWEIYYKEPWQDPQSSCDAQYRASKLKQYLYTRTLDRLCSELKEYAMVKYNRFLRFYVPTHSLINYSHWGIISPESALIDLPTIDGYIAQIWTGTARTPNFYRGICKERTFESACLEYGIMQELVRGTGRDMWFLADPIEDNPNHTWEDYRQNYYRTVVASLFHPDISKYEVSPWPRRVMQGSHRLSDKDSTTAIIPPEYKTNLLCVMHTLRDMADQPDAQWLTKTMDVGILMADSAMYQRICPAGKQYVSDQFSSFFGLALPLLKSGIFARPVQLDNIRRFAGYLDRYKILILSYEYMKPASPDIHHAIAGWVKNGGILVYVGNGKDPFHNVGEWWNTGLHTYNNPGEHLCKSLGLGTNPEEGVYPLGNGIVSILQKDPRQLAEQATDSDCYLNHICTLLHSKGYEVEPSPKLLLRRGCYYITAFMDEHQHETETSLDGIFVDLFDHTLPIVKNPTLTAGSVHLWYDTSAIDKTNTSHIIALSGRATNIHYGQRSLTFTVQSPSEMQVACRIWTKRPPKTIIHIHKTTKTQLAFSYEETSQTTYFTYPACEQPIKISVTF